MLLSTVPQEPPALIGCLTECCDMLGHANSQSNLEVGFYSMRLHAVHETLSRARTCTLAMCCRVDLCGGGGVGELASH